jgi:DNA polymerase III epsilon subunit-like protein
MQRNDLMDYLDGVAVVDLEATSLNTRKGAIASIGMVTFRNGELKRYYRVFRPFKGAKIDKSALAVCGFTLKELNRKCDCKGGEDNCKVLEHAHSPEKVCSYVSEFMHENQCHTIAGQNPAFDTGYLHAYFERYKNFDFISHRTIDLHSIGYGHLASKGMKVPVDRARDGKVSYVRNDFSATKLYQLIGMPTEPKPHNALTGALFEFEAFCRLIYKKPVLEEFKMYKLKTEIL